MSCLPLFLSVLAFALLGLSTDGHHRRRFGSAPGSLRQRHWRGAGWIALALAFPAATLCAGWVFGPILWVGCTMAGAAAAFLALNLLPDRA